MQVSLPARLEMSTSILCVNGHEVTLDIAGPIRLRSSMSVGTPFITWCLRQVVQSAIGLRIICMAKQHQNFQKSEKKQ